MRSDEEAAAALIMDTLCFLEKLVQAGRRAPQLLKGVRVIEEVAELGGLEESEEEGCTTLPGDGSYTALGHHFAKGVSQVLGCDGTPLPDEEVEETAKSPAHDVDDGKRCNPCDEKYRSGGPILE